MRILVAGEPAAGLCEYLLPVAVEIGEFLCFDTKTLEVVFKPE